MIEASYCRKNVISSNCPNGPEEFFLNGKSGYLFKNNDKRDLLNKMKKFLFDSNSEKFNKILLCKKKSRNYTIFNHFKKLETLLNVFKQG